MKSFFWEQIMQDKKDYEWLYQQSSLKVFGKIMKDSELKEAPSDQLISLMCQLEDRIKIHTASIDVEKMAIAIQNSRSGIGGCALTDFQCVFCGKTETWSNTAVPRICKTCAYEMAINMAKQHADVLKTNIVMEDVIEA